MRFKNLAGQQFGRLTPLKPVKMTFRRMGWQCRCTCGNTAVVAGTLLRSGHTKSCGCIQKEMNRFRAIKHGMRKSAEYGIWNSMIQRCHNPNDASYGRYGGRGILVCERWRDSFEAFYKDIGPRPSPQYSLDRIDNSKNYSPENCRWASKKQQERNKRTSRILTWDGKSLTMAEWSEVTGIKVSLIHWRLGKGCSVADALSKPGRK